MATTKINCNVLETAESNLDVARQIYRDLAGKSRDGLTLGVHGEYLTVCDGQDRWLTTVEDYQSSLDAVLEKAIAGEFDADERERGSAPYDALCSGAACLYSRIGSGEYNAKPEELADLLGEDDSADADEVLEYLGIELPTAK